MPGTAHFLKKTKINKFDVTFRNIELWRHKFYYFDGPCRWDPVDSYSVFQDSRIRRHK